MANAMLALRPRHEACFFPFCLRAHFAGTGQLVGPLLCSFVSTGGFITQLVMDDWINGQWLWITGDWWMMMVLPSWYCTRSRNCTPSP